MRCLLLALACLSAAPLGALAGTQAQSSAVREAAARFLTSQAASAYPDARATVATSPLDKRLDLSGCAAPQFVLTPGSRLWSNGTLGVLCSPGGATAFYLSYQIELKGPALLASRPLPANYAPSAQDLVRGVVEYRNDPARYPLDPGQLHNARLLMPLAKGTPLVIGMLRAPELIRAGQRVRIFANGQGFQVSQEGIAQQQAGAGDLLRLKLSNGHYVQGTVQDDGTVSIEP